MNDIGNTLSAIASRAAAANPKEDGDYYGPDGLLYCHKCGTAKQTEVQLPWKDEPQIVACLCKCMKEQRDREEAARKKAEKEMLIRRNRAAAFPEADFADWRFDTDDGGNPKITKIMQNYVEHFDEMYESGKGLLLYGAVGRGKTFAAACVANALLDKGRTVLMTNFMRIVNTTSGMYEGRQEYYDSLNRPDLLILDDLSAERKTEYMQEIVYSIIDARYRAGKPLIVTTNLSLEELKKPSEITSQRIFDRVLEMTVPIEVKGANKRYQKINNDYARMQNLLGL